MTDRPMKDIAASVYQRLLNKARETGRPFGELLQYYAMVKLGEINSRMKDFYDIWLLSRQFDFKGRTLSNAVEKTFSRRGTELPARLGSLIKALTEDKSKEVQWRSFIRKGQLKNAPEEFRQVAGFIGSFMEPVVEAVTAKSTFDMIWRASGPWSGP